MSKWNIPAGNYSGITRIGQDRYVIITDKAKHNGFYDITIHLSPTGRIDSIKNNGFLTDFKKGKIRDSEGIVFCQSTNTVFISAESDQQVLEYNLDGTPTGRKLNIPESFGLSKIKNNYGFEALAYSPETHLFWTTTENSLKADAKPSDNNNRTPEILRFQSFTEDLKPSFQYAYKTDAPTCKAHKHKFYCFGVPEITALDNGTLLVLERELFVSRTYMNSYVKCKIYLVNPTNAKTITDKDDVKNLPISHYLSKTLITSFRTSITRLSNYEGMCLGPTLADGTQTLILVCDSQDNYGNAVYKLKDRIRVIKLSSFSL